MLGQTTQLYKAVILSKVRASRPVQFITLKITRNKSKYLLKSKDFIKSNRQFTKIKTVIVKQLR